MKPISNKAEPTESEKITTPAATDANVDAGVINLLKHQYLWLTILGAILSLAWLLGIVWIGYLYGFDSHLLYLALAPITLWAGYYALLKKKLEDRLFSDFAFAHGLFYDSKGKVDQSYGIIFRLPGTVQASDAVVGSFDSYESSAFLVDQTVSSGKSSTTYHYTGVGLRLGGYVPEVLVANAAFVGQALARESVKGEDKLSNVELEGDFNKHFEVLASDRMAIPVRELLAPDIMAYLIDQGGNYSFEFSGDRLYVYKNDYVNSADELEKMYSLALYLARKLCTDIAGFQKDEQLVAAAQANVFVPKRNYRNLVIFGLLVVPFIIIGLVAIYASRNSAAQMAAEFKAQYEQSITAAQAPLTDPSNASFILNDANRAKEFASTPAEKATAAELASKAQEYLFLYEIKQAQTAMKPYLKLRAVSDPSFAITAASDAERYAANNQEKIRAITIRTSAEDYLGQKDQATRDRAYITQLESKK